jgi:hypothetical protein
MSCVFLARIDSQRGCKPRLQNCTLLSPQAHTLVRPREPSLSRVPSSFRRFFVSSTHHLINPPLCRSRKRLYN